MFKEILMKSAIVTQKYCLCKGMWKEEALVALKVSGGGSNSS